MPYFVSRQAYWPEGKKVVEVVSGGRNYANPGMLVAKFKGEGIEYNDPREAAKAAIEILKAWNEVCPICNATLSCGSTGGNTLPLDEVSVEELLNWAEEEYAELPKCAKCGDILGDEVCYSFAIGEEEKFCSESCAMSYGEEDEQSDAVLD